MSAAHTPGPWSIVIDGTCSAAWPHITGASGTIAELATTHVEKTTRGNPGTFQKKPQRFKPGVAQDQVMANAHLIATAPELLTQLIYLRDCIESGRDPAMSDANAAIAKARGKS